MKRRLLTLSCVLGLALPFSACDGDPDPEVDSGTPAGDAGGGGGTDAGMMMAEAPPPLVTGESREAGTAADFSCRGSVTAPATDGTAGTITLTATDFFSGEPVSGLTVEFFPDNAVTATCDGTCVSNTSGGDGTVSVGANEGAWYAYRVPTGMGTHMSIPETYVTAVQYNEPAPADGGSATLNVVRQSTVNTLTGVLLIQQQPGTSILTGQAVDCNGAPVANARLRVFDSNGEVTFGRDRTGPKSFYFNGDSFPAASESETHVDGLYGAGNVPVAADGELRVELWGVVSEGGEMEMLGCETAQVVEDGITILNVGPTRSDGPSGCSGS